MDSSHGSFLWPEWPVPRSQVAGRKPDFCMPINANVGTLGKCVVVAAVQRRAALFRACEKIGAWPPHSITSSAPASSMGGTVRRILSN
jgi:hypothetical protein